MANKYYEGDITLKTDWGGDSTTDNLPVIGSKVQKVIKEGRTLPDRVSDSFREFRRIY